MGVMAEINGKPAFYNGNPMMFKNYLTESIIHYEPMHNMYHSVYVGPNWNYYNDSSLNVKFYPFYDWIGDVGGWPLFRMITGVHKPIDGFHYNTTGLATPGQSDEQTAQYYYSQSDIVNPLESSEDWSINYWFCANPDWVKDGAFWFEYESYYQEKDKTIFHGPLKIELLTDDASYWYMDAMEGWPQLEPIYSRDYLTYRKNTSTLRITIDGSLNYHQVPNCYFKGTDPSLMSEWNMYTVRKKEKFVECIFNLDFENSLKLNLNQDFHLSGYNRVGLLSNIHNLSGYHREGINA